jgi:hypothetical protein
VERAQKPFFGLLDLLCFFNARSGQPALLALLALASVLAHPGAARLSIHASMQAGMMPAALS